jgi:imidazole glycerol-phosphate synthase subunit HisH
MIVVIDYGMGNLQSVVNAFEYLNQEVIISNDPKIIEKSKGIILPGVGAFADGIKNLKEKNIYDLLTKQVVENKKPFLGICLGMQLIAKTSFEHGEHSGLGWIDAQVKKLVPTNSKFKIPHIGWNDTQIDLNNFLFENFQANPVFYYVHSYALVSNDPKAKIIATANHGIQFISAIQKENIFGVQFHPEKSQGSGLQILKNFIKLVEKHDS